MFFIQVDLYLLAVGEKTFFPFPLKDLKSQLKAEII